MKRIFIVFLLGIFTSSLMAQDFKMPAPSPSVSIDQDFSTSYIKLDYSRPAVKDRKVFGGLIPYDQVWRTGANATTKVSFGEEVEVAGEKIKPGTYTLYTIPGSKEWKVILNTDLDNWGAAGYDEKKNVLAVDLPVNKLNQPQESFSLTVEDITSNSANLVLAWADVKIEIPVKADNHQRIMRHLEMAMRGENPPYMSAASYYLSSGEKLEEAEKYIGEAIEQNPEAYYMYWTQAQIYEKLGKNKKALKSARQAAEMAKKSSPAYAHEYQRNYENMRDRIEN
ncbi:MAG TPA: DUF2911 domain-containing protein [Flavobacteriaceae bacterium]|nr:DUF2911 domain-containing protein [Flavobacteriaceae bacterium]